MVKITVSKKYGREVTADQYIYQNDTIVSCELLVLGESDTKIVNTTDLQFYTFKYNEVQDCLVLGHGEIFNHSDTPNAKYELTYITSLYEGSYQTRKVMKFTALRDIQRDEQIFIDYTQDVNVDASKYVDKNLV